MTSDSLPSETPATHINSATPQPATPPPLTPKDSLSVEVEEIRKGLIGEDERIILDDNTEGHVHLLFSIVEDLMKENVNLDALSTDAFKKMIKAHSENIRLRAALEKLSKLGNGDLCGNSVGNQIALDALADGKEGQQKNELEACQWCDKPVSHLIQITDKPDMHDARICEDCYSKEFPEVDGKEGGK